MITKLNVLSKDVMFIMRPRRLLFCSALMNGYTDIIMLHKKVIVCNIIVSVHKQVTNSTVM